MFSVTVHTVAEACETWDQCPTLITHQFHADKSAADHDNAFCFNEPNCMFVHGLEDPFYVLDSLVFPDAVAECASS